MELFPRLQLICPTPNSGRVARCLASAHRPCSLCALAALTLLASQSALAATKTWDAGGGDLLWNTGNNWNTNGTPASGDTVVFAASFASGSAINLNGNRTIDDLYITSAADFSLNNNRLTIDSGDIARTAVSGTTTLYSEVALGGSGNWNIAGTTTAGTLSARGIVSGDQDLTKSGLGTLVLSNANSYAGDTTVSAGVLRIQNSAALGTTAGNTIVREGGELQMQGGISVAAGETLSLTGTGAGGTGSAALRNISGDNSWTGAITLQNEAGVVRINSDADTLTLGNISESKTKDKILTFGGAGHVAVRGVISSSGNDIALVKDGTGTLTLFNANTYTSKTTVSGGRLTVAATATINSTSAVAIGAGEFNYNSATALSQGVAFSSSGGTLSGSGTITPAVTVTSGNTHAPGVVGDPGTQRFAGSLTYATGSIFEWDLDAPASDSGTDAADAGSYDRVVAGGAVIGSSIFKVVLGTNGFTQAFWDTNKSWTDLFTKGLGSADLALIFTSFGGGGVASNGRVDNQGLFRFTGDTLYWYAQAGDSAVLPEPTSAMAALLLAAGLLRRRRA